MVAGDNIDRHRALCVVLRYYADPETAAVYWRGFRTGYPRDEDCFRTMFWAADKPEEAFSPMPFHRQVFRQEIQDSLMARMRSIWRPEPTTCQWIKRGGIPPRCMRVGVVNSTLTVSLVENSYSYVWAERDKKIMPSLITGAASVIALSDMLMRVSGPIPLAVGIAIWRFADDSAPLLRYIKNTVGSSLFGRYLLSPADAADIYGHATMPDFIDCTVVENMLRAGIVPSKEIIHAIHFENITAPESLDYLASYLLAGDYKIDRVKGLLLCPERIIDSLKYARVAQYLARVRIGLWNLSPAWPCRNVIIDMYGHGVVNKSLFTKVSTTDIPELIDAVLEFVFIKRRVILKAALQARRHFRFRALHYFISKHDISIEETCAKRKRC